MLDHHSHSSDASPALVVGLSIHGLAVVRALARRGIEVHGLSEIESPPQPTVYTRFAKVHFRSGLNAGSLTDTLIDVANQIGSHHKIVLFPTSDRIVKAIAQSWEVLGERFLLSWSECRDLVLKLQRKDHLAAYCEHRGIVHPKSNIVHAIADCDDIAGHLRFPIAVKPAQPLSSFKALRIGTPLELQNCVRLFERDLPFVVQEWIDGPEPSLYSCTTYMKDGKPMLLFTSRKLAASPPGTGQGTVFETVDNEETREIAARFLAGSGLVGPVALEFKRDDDGKFWLIEPNVGRTEYCVDLAIQSGFDLPYLEYLHVTGKAAENQLPRSTRDCVWFDTDKDPRCFFSQFGAIRGNDGHRRHIVFPFLGHGDLRPLVASIAQLVRSWLRAVQRRIAAGHRAATSH